jgi:hypothetical protein
MVNVTTFTVDVHARTGILGRGFMNFYFAGVEALDATANHSVALVT